MRFWFAFLIAAGGALVAQVPAVTNGVAMNNGLNCAWTGSSPIATCTASPSSATAAVLDSLKPNTPGDEAITMAGDAVIYYVEGVNIGSLQLTLNTSPPSGDSGAAISKLADNIQYNTLRIFAANTPACFPTVAYDTTSHSGGGSYTYRTYQGVGPGGASTLQERISVGSLLPAKPYFFQVQCNPTSGSITNQGVGSEFSITTAAQPNSTLPQAPAFWDPGVIDTTGYTVFPVPAFADGIVTGSIVSGDFHLTVNLTGLQPHHWIRIAGATCNLLTLPAQPDCQIATVSGTAVTLTSNVTGTVTNAAVTWSLYTINDFLNHSNAYHLNYGKLIQFAQGYRPEWYPQNFSSNGPLGILLDYLPADTNPGCALFPSPCALDDPAHRWIVIETAPTPGFLPPSTTTGGGNYQPSPSDPWISNYGGMTLASNYNPLNVATPAGGDALVFNATSASGIAHHFAIRRLYFTMDSNFNGAGTSTDPESTGGWITSTGGTGVAAQSQPGYWVLDGNLFVQPNEQTRVSLGAITPSGGPWVIENNYLPVAYWRPIQPLSNACSSTTSTITVAKEQWKANNNDNLYNMPGTAALTPSGYTGPVFLQLSSAGLIDWSYLTGGGGTISCSGSGCGAGTSFASIPNSGNVPTNIPGTAWNPAEVPVCGWAVASGVVGSGGNYGDSFWASEGTAAIYWNNGPGPNLVRNNYTGCTGDCIFNDSPGIATYPNNTQVQNVTESMNTVEWFDTHRQTSSTWNGYRYVVRQGIETKHCRVCAFTGNHIKNVWANVSQGAAMTLSSRFTNQASTNNGAESLEGISDITAAYNWFDNNSAGIYAQGGNAGNPGTTILGWNVGDPPLLARLNVHDNFMFPFSNGEQVSPPSQLFGEAWRWLNGVIDTGLHHNTVFGVGTAVQNPLEFFINYIAASGFDVHSNVLEVVTGAQANGAVQMDSSLAVSGYSYQPAMVTTNYLTQMQSSFPLSLSMINNVHILGDPYTQTNVDAYKNLTGSLFNGLAAGNYFPNGATQALRVAASGYPNIATGDGTCVPNANNPCEAGVNIAAMESALGLVTNVQAIASDTAAQITYTTPDLNKCTLEVSSGSISAADAGGARNRTTVLTGLSPSTSYSGQVLCYRSQTGLAFPSEPLSLSTSFTFHTIASGTRPMKQGFTMPPGANSVTMVATPISGSGTVTETCTIDPCTLPGLSAGPVNITMTFWSNTTGGGTQISVQPVQVQ